MHDAGLILTLTGGLAAALVCGYVTQRLGLSPIVGYLLAGVAVGPTTPGFVANHDLANELAEIGVVLLMFGVGLHFHFKELLAVRRVALPGAVGQSLVATVLGAAAAAAFGYDWSSGVVLGLAISVASTVVLTRVLSDNHELHAPTGHIAVRWLVVEDIFTVLVLVVMPVVFGDRPAGALQLIWAMTSALLKIGVLVASTLLLGGRVVPKLLGFAAATHSRELFTLTILVVALGIAVGSAELFGVSMALGAFLAGMVVGRSEFSLRAAAEALPMRDAFAVLFFVSVGMLFDFPELAKSPGLFAATLAIVLLGKPLAALAIVLFLRYPLRVALAVAIALAQIGEFSFILATLGKQLAVFDDGLTNCLVACAIVSISLNPILYRLLGPLERSLARRPRLWRWLNARAGAATEATEAAISARENAVDPRHRAIVVGYGPVGRTLARLLRENGVVPTIVELNLETFRRLNDERIAAVYGDASRPETLHAAGIERAGAFVLSASGAADNPEVIRLVRELNPRIRILARCAYLHEGAALRAAGADAIFSGEGEVALAMTESVLQDLGATPEQIDRERERLRVDLIGPPRAAPIES